MSINNVEKLSLKTFCLLSVSLLIVSVSVYGNSLFNGFVWDDNQIILNNPVNYDLKNTGKIFIESDIVFSDDVTGYYRPLNRLTYLFDYYIFGLNPIGYHFVNIILHSVNVFILFIVGLRLFKLPVAAFVSSIFFAVHPINTEAVNFVSGRNNVLSTFFVLLTVLFFLKGEKSGRRFNFFIAGFTFLFGVLSKEIALMVLPFLLFSPCLNPSVKYLANLRVRILTLGPCWIAALLYLVARIIVLPMPLGSGEGVGLFQRLSLNIYAIPKYLAIVFFPFNLENYYTIPIDYGALWGPLLLAWLAIIWVMVSLLKRPSVPIWFGLLWLVVNYIPVCHLVPFASAPIAERYAYLPAVGMWLLAGNFVQSLCTRGLSHRLWISCSAVLFCMLAFLTWQRNYDWRDDFSLFSALVRSNPESAYGHYNLGNSYRLRGDFESARRHWERTVEIDPCNANALNQLGNVAFYQDRSADAERYYQQALAIAPQNSEAHFNLARILEQTGRYEAAISHYRKFLQRVPPEYVKIIPDVEKRIRELHYEYR